MDPQARIKRILKAAVLLVGDHPSLFALHAYNYNVTGIGQVVGNT